jgi:hypothetical protein
MHRRAYNVQYKHEQGRVVRNIPYLDIWFDKSHV